MLDVEFLRYESVTGIINAFKLPDLKLKASGILPEIGLTGQTKVWDVRGVPRDIGKFQGKHSPAGTKALSTLGQRSAILARTFLETPVQGSHLLALRTPGTDNREKLAQNAIASAQLEQRQQIDRQDEFMIAGALQGGFSINIDGLTTSIDYGFAADHKPTVGSGIPVTWDDEGADILEDLSSFKHLISEGSGRTAATVWCSSETIKRLMQNDTVKEYFASTQAGVDALVNGVITRFYGLNWIAYDDGYLNEAGNFTRYLPENKLIVVPSPDQEWGEMSVGTDVVPDEDDKGFSEKQGLYAFARGNYNPPSISMFAGKVRLPIIKLPGAIVAATVTP
jgi:hypothetical protein